MYNYLTLSDLLSIENVPTSRNDIKTCLENTCFTQGDYSIAIDKIKKDKCDIVESINGHKYKHSFVLLENVFDYVTHRAKLFQYLIENIEESITEDDTIEYTKQLNNIEFVRNSIVEELQDLGIQSEISFNEAEIVLQYDTKENTSIRIFQDIRFDSTSINDLSEPILKFVNDLTVLTKSDISYIYEYTETLLRMLSHLRKLKLFKIKESQNSIQFKTDIRLLMTSDQTELKYDITENTVLKIDKITSRKCRLVVSNNAFGLVYRKTLVNVLSNSTEYGELVDTLHSLFKI